MKRHCVTTIADRTPEPVAPEPAPEAIVCE